MLRRTTLAKYTLALAAQAALTFTAGSSFAVTAITPSSWTGADSSYTTGSQPQALAVDFDSQVTSGSGLPQHLHGSTGASSSNVATLGQSNYLSEWFGNTTGTLNNSSYLLVAQAVQFYNHSNTCDSIFGIGEDGYLVKGEFSGSCTSATIPGSWATYSTPALTITSGTPSVAVVSSDTSVVVADDSEDCDTNFNSYVYLINSSKNGWIEQSGLCGYEVSASYVNYFVIQQQNAGDPDQLWQVVNFIPRTTGSPLIGDTIVSEVGLHIFAFAYNSDEAGGYVFIGSGSNGLLGAGPNGTSLWAGNSSNAPVNLSFGSDNSAYGEVTSIVFDVVNGSGLYFVYGGHQVMHLTLSQLSTGAGFTI